MQKLLIIVAFICLVFACTPSDENANAINPYEVDLSTVEATSTVSTLSTTITDLSGMPVTDIQPSKEYKLTLKGSEANFLRIRRGDGFDVISNPSASVVGESSYTIKTHPDFSDFLYINIVPLHQASGTLTRERPQVVTLPN